MLSFLKNMLQLLLSPANGWEEVSYDNTDPKVLASHGLYPLMAIASACAFVEGVYETSYDVALVIQHAMIDFISLLVAYLAGAALMESFVDHFTTKDISARKSQTVAVYTVSVLCVVQIIDNLVPFSFALIKFLPAFAAIVLWRATAYLSVDKDKEGLYIVFSIGVMILPWIVISSLLDLLV